MISLKYSSSVRYRLMELNKTQIVELGYVDKPVIDGFVAVVTSREKASCNLILEEMTIGVPVDKDGEAAPNETLYLSYIGGEFWFTLAYEGGSRKIPFEELFCEALIHRA